MSVALGAPPQTLYPGYRLLNLVLSICFKHMSLAPQETSSPNPSHNPTVTLWDQESWCSLLPPWAFLGLLVCVHMCACMYVCTHAFACVRVCMYVYLCMCVFMCMCMQVYIVLVHVCVHVHCARVGRHICVHVCAYVWVYLCVCVLCVGVLCACVSICMCRSVVFGRREACQVVWDQLVILLFFLLVYKLLKLTSIKY